MKIETNKVVELSYELEVDGKIVDRAGEERPLDYIHGTKMLLPKFESELEGKSAGDDFAFTLSPEEGYGEYDPKMVIELPEAAFSINGEVQRQMLFVGNMIPMLNSAGMVERGVVKELRDGVVVMDFNHQMAGKTLKFKGKVLSVREAAEKELTEGLHGEYLPHDCHCSGGCHGGCHGEDGCSCGEDGCGDGCDCHHEEGGEGCGCHGEGHDGCGCHGEGHGGCCHHDN